jgi:membrane-bound inhibitor of C-type lysozyme
VADGGLTGSGVRYQAIDPASGLIWHSKGDDGFLARDSGSGQETLLDNCRAIGN